MSKFSRRICGYLATAILMLTILSCSILPLKLDPTITPISTSAETLTPNFTPTVNNTLTPSFTSSPNQTNTPTPQPGWVTDFTQPIIDAIANLTPSFQDDFGLGSAGWEEDWCEGSMKYIEGELVATKCRFFRPNTDWRDFALEVDMHFLEDTTSSGEWALHFRDLGNSGHSLTLYHNNYLAINFEKGAGEFNRVEFDDFTLSNDQTQHILLIAKGNRFAFYLNGEPLYYTENDLYRFGRCVFYVESGTVAMDNFRIWNISDIPTP